MQKLQKIPILQNMNYGIYTYNKIKSWYFRFQLFFFLNLPTLFKTYQLTYLFRLIVSYLFKLPFKVTVFRLSLKLLFKSLLKLMLPGYLWKLLVLIYLFRWHLYDSFLNSHFKVHLRVAVSSDLVKLPLSSFCKLPFKVTFLNFIFKLPF